MAAPPDLSQVFGLQQGEVTTFDDQVGAGRVATASGAIWPFHCTSITGGSRTIAVDTAVSFRVAPGPTGLEAVDVSPA